MIEIGDIRGVGLTMKTNRLIATVVELFLAFSTGEIIAVTHTIVNTSGRDINGLVYYRGRVDFLKSCRPDTGVIQSNGKLVSHAGGCLLDYVQINDNGKIITLKVANASANIAESVAGVISSAGSRNQPSYLELVVHAGTSTIWVYDGVSLVPTVGVTVYGKHDFSKSN